MEFETLYELLLAVRDHKLEPGESLIPLSHVTGSEVGYVVAGSKGPAIYWRISRKKALATSNARNKVGYRVRELVSSYMGRKQLIKELKKLNLEDLLEVPVEEPPKQLEFPGLR
jgi:hypothetical protein